MSFSNDPDPEPTAPHLWGVLRAYIEQTYSLFGAPTAIARKIWLSRTEHKLIANWLTMLEALLRRLIFLDAATLKPEPTPPRPEAKSRKRATMLVSTGANFDLDNSETWRANFKLGVPKSGPSLGPPESSPACPPNFAPTPKPAPLINAYATAPLALRLEAIIRGYNNREALAQDLANRLHAQPQAAEAFQRPPPKPRTPIPGWQSVLDCLALTRAIPASAFCDSS